MRRAAALNRTGPKVALLPRINPGNSPKYLEGGHCKLGSPGLHGLGDSPLANGNNPGLGDGRGPMPSKNASAVCLSNGVSPGIVELVGGSLDAKVAASRSAFFYSRRGQRLVRAVNGSTYGRA